MSSEIYYDRAFIRVDDRYIPIVKHSSSNCFEFEFGREVPENQWSVLNYGFHGQLLFTEDEIRQIAARYDTLLSGLDVGHDPTSSFGLCFCSSPL